MAYEDAARLLAVSAVVLLIVAAATTARAVVATRRGGIRGSIVQPILVLAVAAVALAVIHVLIGGQLQAEERRGLWAEGTLFVFPTSVGALGASMTSLWAVLWTAEASERKARGDIAAARRRDAADLVYFFDRFDEEATPVRSLWFGSGARGHEETRSAIRHAWEEIVRELHQKESSWTTTLPCHCAVHLPDINVFLPDTEYGSSDSLGCVHFREALKPRLENLYKNAKQVAAFRFVAMQSVTATMNEIRPILKRLRMNDKIFLADGVLYAEVYPAKPPDPATAEGRFMLARTLAWIAHGATDREEWEGDLKRMGNQLKIRVERRFPQERRDAKWEEAHSAYARRVRLREVLLRRLRGTQENLCAGSDDDFWDGVIGEAASSIAPRA